MADEAQVDQGVVIQPPVPKPRARYGVAKQSLLSAKSTNENSNGAKPPISAKPKIASKPSIRQKPTLAKQNSEADSEKTSINRKTRPLSVKVTDDGVHNQVASELASILGRPRSSSKGLLSPTNYSSQPISVNTSNDHSPTSSGMKAMLRLS